MNYIKPILILILVSIMSIDLNAQIPNPYAGKVIRISDFPSIYVQPRNIDIWLPENFSSNKKYFTLYMHDGQNLFDSTITWNGQEWDIDRTLTELIRSNKIHECIVIGIWNTGINRFSEYFPQKPFNSLPDSIKLNVLELANGRIKSDDYLKFIVFELKPFVDSIFSLKSEQTNTLIGGASMGGLISIYAMCEYPDVFSGALCFSTHWTGIRRQNNDIPNTFLSYIKENMPIPGKHKIYFDIGTVGLDELYLTHQDKVDMVIKDMGYRESEWITKIYEGEDHSERSWQKRFRDAIYFFLKKN